MCGDCHCYIVYARVVIYLPTEKKRVEWITLLRKVFSLNGFSKHPEGMSNTMQHKIMITTDDVTKKKKKIVEKALEEEGEGMKVYT